MDCSYWCNSANTVNHHSSFKASDHRKSTAYNMRIMNALFYNPKYQLLTPL